MINAITKNNFQEAIAIYGYDYIVARIGVEGISRLARNILAPIIEEFALREKEKIDSTELLDFFESNEGAVLASLAGLKGSNGLIEAAYGAADIAIR